MQLPGHGAILSFMLLLAVATFLVRIWYPIDRWGHVLIAPVEWAHLPHYGSLFMVGIVAYRSNWFHRLPARTGWVWLGIGLDAAILRYTYALGADGFLPPLSGGGLTWPALIWSVWETLIAVSLAVGVPILFRERLNTGGRLLCTLSGTTYTAYLIHLPIVLCLQVALVNAPLLPLVKFALVTALGVPLCFLLSAATQKLPYAQRVL